MPVFRVTLDQLWRGQTIQNVMHLSDGGTNETQQQVADKMVANWIQFVRFLQVNELSYVNVKVQQLGANIGPPLNQQINVFGTQGASTRLLTFTSFVLKVQAFAPGRKAYGRMFIAGHVDGAFVNGLIENGQLLFWNNQVLPQIRDAYMGIAPTTGLNWGLITNGDPSTFRSVETVQVRTIAGVQRRRNLGTGI